MRYGIAVIIMLPEFDETNMWTRERCAKLTQFPMQITLWLLVFTRRMPKLIENMKNYETQNQECQEWRASPSTSTVYPMPDIGLLDWTTERREAGRSIQSFDALLRVKSYLSFCFFISVNLESSPKHKIFLSG